MTPVLRTEHLEFVPYRPEDEDAFVTLLRNEQVCHWMGQDLSPEPEVRRLFGLLQTEVYPKEMFDVWGLWLDGTYVGHAEVKKTGNVEGYELIAALAPEYWGRGLGTEVVRGPRRHPPSGSRRSTGWWGRRTPRAWRCAAAWVSGTCATWSPRTAR
jgi:RimJ/RimL family protein N-acetyltransferase